MRQIPKSREDEKRLRVALIVALFATALFIVPAHAQNSASVSGIFAATLHKGIFTYKVDILNTSPVGFNITGLLIGQQYLVVIGTFPFFSDMTLVKSPNPGWTCTVRFPGYIDCLGNSPSAEIPPGVTAHVVFTSTTPPPATIPYGASIDFGGFIFFAVNGFATPK